MHDKLDCWFRLCVWLVFRWFFQIVQGKSGSNALLETWPYFGRSLNCSLAEDMVALRFIRQCSITPRWGKWKRSLFCLCRKQSSCFMAKRNADIPRMWERSFFLRRTTRDLLFLVLTPLTSQQWYLWNIRRFFTFSILPTRKVVLDWNRSRLSYSAFYRPGFSETFIMRVLRWAKAPGMKPSF